MTSDTASSASESNEIKANEMQSGRRCPICDKTQGSELYAEANFDPARLDDFAFASRKIPEYMHYELNLCRDCDLVYSSVAPDASRLTDCYEQASYDSQVESEFAATAYARLIRRVLGRLQHRNAALDIGAGDGAFLLKLREFGFQTVRGIEPSLAPINAAHPSIRDCIDHGVFSADLYPDRRFSLITCFQTIEHVLDPLQLAKDAYQMLEPGGVFCLVGHNRHALSARILGRRSPIFDIEHLQLFSLRSSRLLLVNSGFHSIDVRSFWNRYPLSYWTKLFPFPRPIKGPVLSSLAATRIGQIPFRLPAGNQVAWGVR